MDTQTVINRPVIAVTGSSGKTTTKEMIASILQRRWKTFKSIENGNDVWFTSQYVNQIDSSYDMVVLEYGMTHLGNIAQHCRLIQPNIGIITNVGTAHIGNFENGLSGIVSAKSELIKGMNPEGILLLNADDFNSTLLASKGFTGEKITIGILNKADYQAYEVQYFDRGMLFQVILDGVSSEFYILSLGRHNVLYALFAVTVSHLLGMSIVEIKEGLKTYYKSYGRLQIYYLKNDITLIDDSFNAKACAMKAGIDVLSDIGKGTNIAVLGRINDLEEYSLQIHKEVGYYLADKNIDYLFTISEEAEQIGKGAIESGFSKNKVIHFSSLGQLNNILLGKLHPKTTLLFKGYTGFPDEEKTLDSFRMNETISQLINYYKP